MVFERCLLACSACALFLPCAAQATRRSLELQAGVYQTGPYRPVISKSLQLTPVAPGRLRVTIESVNVASLEYRRVDGVIAVRKGKATLRRPDGTLRFTFSPGQVAVQQTGMSTVGRVTFGGTYQRVAPGEAQSIMPKPATPRAGDEWIPAPAWHW
jgi:hypothetical protein